MPCWLFLVYRGPFFTKSIQTGKKVFRGKSKYPETSKVDLSAKKVNGFQPSTMVAKTFIFDLAGFQWSGYSLNKVLSALEKNYSEVDPEILLHPRSAIHNMSPGVPEISSTRANFLLVAIH